MVITWQLLYKTCILKLQPFCWPWTCADALKETIWLGLLGWWASGSTGVAFAQCSQAATLFQSRCLDCASQLCHLLVFEAACAAVTQVSLCACLSHDEDLPAARIIHGLPEATEADQACSCGYQKGTTTEILHQISSVAFNFWDLYILLLSDTEASSGKHSKWGN